MRYIHHLLSNILSVSFLCILFLYAFYTFSFPKDGHNKNHVAENRQAATFPYPEKPYTHFFLDRFPQKFNQFYQNNFPFREKLITAYSYINFFWLDAPIKSFLTKGFNGWVFKDFAASNAWQAKHSSFFSFPTIYTLNIRVPFKFQFYREYLPHSYQQKHIPPTSIKKSGSEPHHILDLLPVLQQAKKHYPKLYYKLDPHWNHTGRFIAYQEVVKHLQTAFPDIVPLQKSDFTRIITHNLPSEFAKVLYLKEYLSETDELYLHKNSCHLQQKEIFSTEEERQKYGTAWDTSHLQNSCTQNNKKLMVIGNSFLSTKEHFTGMSRLLSYHFQDVYYFRSALPDKTDIKSLIDRFTPDALLVQYYQ